MTNPETVELKPCPFCGSKDVIIKSSWLYKNSFSPSCNGENDCPGSNQEQDEQGGFIAEYNTREEAIEAWNTRAQRTPN